MSHGSQPPVSLWPDPDALGPVTDLYQITMMAGYHALGMAEQSAKFELFVRRLPSGRSYLVFAGLEQALGDLLRLRFSHDQVAWLRTLPSFGQVDPGFFDWLERVRFEGDVWAMPEGTVAFAGEPIVRVEAPLAQAQWVETILIASLNYPTLVASKAARMVSVAEGRPLFDFGCRRAHGPQAGLLAARAAYLAGFAGTSHVEAARRLRIPCIGTMAHSWVQSFAGERGAFEAFARVFPGSTTLLVDTYDTLEGIRRAAELDPPVAAVRLDSGDLASLAREARALLDARGRSSTKILASGDLEERRIDELVRDGVPIDAFGVGTEMVTSRDAPALSMVYKLVELEGQGRIKLSTGKKTYPLAKQVYRREDDQGRFRGDHVTRADEMAEGEPLLVPVVRAGRLVAPLPTLDDIRHRFRNQFERLGVELRGLDSTARYSPSYSDALEREAERLFAVAEPSAGRAQRASAGS